MSCNQIIRLPFIPFIEGKTKYLRLVFVCLGFNAMKGLGVCRIKVLSSQNCQQEKNNYKSNGFDT